MKKIVFDLLNNDNGQCFAIRGAKRFLSENPDYKLILVGNREMIEKEFVDVNQQQYEIFENNDIAKKIESPRDALKANSSMFEAFELLSSQSADGILSSGDSASFIILSSLKIKRLPGISRPAFMPIVPTSKDKNILVLDVGANINVKPEYLLEWAKISVQYYEAIYGKKNPVIGQLNIGTEHYKGNDVAKAAYELIKNDQDKFIFKGFVEPESAINGEVDILVADGYAGNIFLKTLESSFLAFSKMLKGIFLTNFITKMSALLVKKHFKKLKDRFDYRNTGGAFIVGLEKIVVKAHGGSDDLAFYNALNQIKLAIDKNIIEKLKLINEENNE
ncbi:phosphate acyltransferase PlsX [Mycoplasma phocoeninasale]|uniref:Phosphate acyltransferase n=1 Tax=Mycoplasma phocoeninasale TaxID=2726117 RepID=A0A858U533_9MOLU|nr:phosphate acyltransferase PlsX [Mycoplasma phocoeninasale]MBN0970512.1 phosphate acyltransferase PlsX [Mycoplasma phocoeninasale]QJG66365.1 phosphate acyltransferase PlsX [Mycoplasma phocoeninasale]